MEKIKIYFQNFLSYFVLAFCFFLFPIYLIYFSTDLYFKSIVNNYKQVKLAEMNNSLEYLNKYSNNKKYFHYLLSNISEYAQKSVNPLNYLKTNINNLRDKYPNGFQFIVWDEKGIIIKELSDRTGYTYALNKMYECLSEVTEAVKLNSAVKISNLASVKKNLGILNKVLGKIFIPENLKKPVYDGADSGPLLSDLGNDYSYVWFSIKNKISFLCFISDKLLNDYTGLEKITKIINKNTDYFCGFSVTPNYEIAKSSFPVKYISDLALSLSVFENGENSIYDSERAFVKMSMPQPNIRTFCFMPKNNEIWNNKISRNIWFGIFTSLLLLVYDFIGFRYIYRHHFFSISWKLTSLFLIANLVPIFILAFVTNRYITNKKISLKNEIIEDIERTMRDLDIEYRYFFEQYSMKINYFADDISKCVKNEIIKEKEINRIAALYDDFNPSLLFLIASSGQIITSKITENSSSFSPSFISSLSINSLKYLNNIKDEIEQNNGDAFSFVFDPEKSGFYKAFVKNIGHVSEFFLGNLNRILYFYTFGDKENFNNNYLLTLLWDIDKFQNLFLKENIDSLSNSFPEAKFGIKSNVEKSFWGSESLKEYLNSNYGKTEKIIENIEINGEKYFSICMNGSNLENWTLMAVYPEKIIDNKVYFYILQVIVIAFTSLLLTIIIGQLLSLHFLNPIHNISKAVNAIKEHNFSYSVPVGDKDEFGRLNLVFNRVIEGLGDFEVAKVVQESLLPGNRFDFGEFDIFAKSLVMTTLGGDYYDCFKIDDKFIGILIGDMAGHGIPAGLMMAMAKSAVLSASNEIKMNPSALAERMHKMFLSIKNNRLKRMMTFQYYVLNLETGHFIFTNAGHSYPIIVDNHLHKASFISCASFPLGVCSKFICKNHEFDLNKGQSLVLYTDGIIESANDSHEQFGYDRFLEYLPDFYNINPETFYDNFYNKVYKNWISQVTDDLTLIVINRK